MSRYCKPKATKTYANEQRALRAVYDKYPAASEDGLVFIIHRNDEGRYFPIFIGERAIQALVHFHFTVMF